MATSAKVQPGVGAEDERYGQTLVQHFRRSVEERGAAPALCFRAGSRFAAISWAEFGRASERWTGFLMSQGVQEREHVAIWSNNRPEWHIADTGILCACCIPVPVYLTLSAEQAGYVLQHSGSRVVLVENEKLRDRVLEVRGDLPELLRIVVIDTDSEEAADGFAVSWQRALREGERFWDGHRGDAVRRRDAVTLDDVATLIYTSGTTGPPKAVQLTHKNLAGALYALEEVVESGPDDRVISYLPLAHIAERLSTEFRSYVYGNPVWFLDALEHLGERLREVRPTAFFGVPRIWEKMMAQVQKGLTQLSPPQRVIARWAVRAGERSLEGDTLQRRESRALQLAERLVLRRLRLQLGFDDAKLLASGAAPLAPEVIRFFAALGLPIHEVYGQTENCGCTSMNRRGAARVGTVGTALRGNEIRIADDGEILVKGQVVFSGYFKEEEATRETLTDGWLHTGDVGELDADGYLRITDRKKDLIITAGGKNISPSNIEQLLGQHKLVGHAVAIGDGRPYVSALLTLDPGEAAAFAKQHGLGDDLERLAGSDELHRELETHVQAVNAHLSQVEQVKKWEVIPGEFEVGDELTPTMKVKRKVVAEKYSQHIESLYKR